MRLISNRAAIIVRPKTPFVEWVRNADDESKHITAENIGMEPNIYMIYDYDMDGEKDQLVAENFKEIFEEELNGWITDESMWPKNRNLETFLEWFHVDFHTMVFDLTEEDYIFE